MSGSLRSRMIRSGLFSMADLRPSAPVAASRIEKPWSSNPARRKRLILGSSSITRTVLRTLLMDFRRRLRRHVRSARHDAADCRMDRRNHPRARQCTGQLAGGAAGNLFEQPAPRSSIRSRGGVAPGSSLNPQHAHNLCGPRKNPDLISKCCRWCRKGQQRVLLNCCLLSIVAARLTTVHVTLTAPAVPRCTKTTCFYYMVSRLKTYI